MSVDQTASQKTASSETASSETASQGTASQGTASQGTASQGTASQGTASRGTASRETGNPANEGVPWYNKGLQFTCTQCGDCCTGAPGVVWVTDEELLEIAEYLGKPIGEIRLFHTRIVRGRQCLTEFANGDCTFFDPGSRKCMVYRARPVQCRTWPFWDSHLQSPETWKKVCDVCPGAGEGAFFSLEQIEERAKRIDM